MLIHLGIRDLAVVEALDLDFEPGLTVLTGETGAGKSILLTALGLALGDRADSGFVRPGAEKAEINIVFDVSDSPDAQRWLEENELTADGECLVRRVVGQDGRSKAFVNSRPVTLQALQDLGVALAEIHGQHAHVKLLKAGEQRRLLDEAAGNLPQLAKVEMLCRQWRRLRDELDRHDGDAKERSAREDLIRYQIDELQQFDIASLDYSALVEEHQLQANIGRILTTGQAQLDLLYEGETQSVSAGLARTVHELSDLIALAPGFEESLVLLQEAQVQVKEAALSLRRELDRMEADPARLEWLEQRLADIHRLARKHQVRPEELADHVDALQVELNAMTRRSENLEDLQDRFNESEIAYESEAAILTSRRRAAASSMAERISLIIRELGMPQGRMLVEVTPAETRDPSPHGEDQVEFMVSTNPGLPPRPMAKVASGGELSRISLAIQVAATGSKTVPTLVFDEVDTGVGGGTAEIVGQKLRLLATQGRQVFCVTHLPQVAAQGHNHWLVEKTEQSGMTQSKVRKIEGESRTREIARMLGGVKLTRQTLAHAEEMLNLRTHDDGVSNEVTS